MKILFVEDEPLILMDIEIQLQEAGHDVASVQNADRAIEILIKRCADLILTDVEMPGSMDGLRLTAAAVRDRWPPIEIVVISGKKRPSVDELPTRARFLAKPLQPAEFLKAIDVW